MTVTSQVWLPHTYSTTQYCSDNRTVASQFDALTFDDDRAHCQVKSITMIRRTSRCSSSKSLWICWRQELRWSIWVSYCNVVQNEWNWPTTDVVKFIPKISPFLILQQYAMFLYVGFQDCMCFCCVVMVCYGHVKVAIFRPRVIFTLTLTMMQRKVTTFVYTRSHTRTHIHGQKSNNLVIKYIHLSRLHRFTCYS